MPTATHATVSINSIRVVDSSVNTTSEPGSSAEWRLTCIVNGQAATWSNDDVKDNTAYSPNWEFPNVPIGPQGMISIQISGFEHDSTSANDVLPLLMVTVNPAEGFLLGGTRWSPLAQSSEGSYMIEYTIRPAIHQALTIARRFAAVIEDGGSTFQRRLQDNTNVGRALNQRNFQRFLQPLLLRQRHIYSDRWDGFIQRWKNENENGKRLVRLASFVRDSGEFSFGDTSERIFLGTFEKGSDAHGLWVAPWASFEAKWQEWSSQGLRLVDLATYQDGNNIMYAGVFRSGNDRHALSVSDWAGFEAKWQELSNQGLRLVAVDTFLEGNIRKFAGVYREGSDGYALWAGANETDFKSKVAEFAGNNLHLVDLAAYAENRDQKFIGAFRHSSRKRRLVVGDYAAVEAEINRASASGGQLVSIDSYQPGQEG
ncbi:MAG: hypothetical protein ACRCWF_17660 [Beijerinckiaceae bacterium]